MRAIAAGLRALPRSVALALGAALGQIGWWSGIRRRLVLANLAQALPTATPRERRAIAVKAARNFGRTVCEFLRFSGADRRQILDLIRIEGLDVVQAALAEGRGAVLVTPHLGAWALYVTALAAAGVPSALLVGVQRNPKVNQLILAIPGDAVQFISKAKSSPREILKALQANKVMVMVADHYSSDQKVFVPFLGRDAYTLPLPGSLVARHRLPLLLMAGHRVAAGRHVLRLHRIAVPKRDTVEEMRLEVARQCNAALGEAILEHPEQYFWYHNRWKIRKRKKTPRAAASSEHSQPAPTHR